MDHPVAAQWGTYGLATVSVVSALYTAFKERSWIGVTGRVVEVLAFREKSNLKVIDADSSKEEDIMVTYAPRIEFTSRQGPVTFISSIRSSEKAHPVGSTVRVLYNPDDPSGAHIDSIFVKYLASFLSGFFALLCYLIFTFG